MNDLKKSLEFTENVLQEKVQKCQGKAENLDERIWEIYEWHLNPEYVHNKLVDLEDRSRRNNLRIDALRRETEGWLWSWSRKTFQRETRHWRQIYHRKIQKSKNTQTQLKKKQPRTIICRLLNYRDKDFSQESLEHRRELWKQTKRLHEEEDKIAYLNYCSIVVRNKTI